jgi:hypothetical protein
MILLGFVNALPNAPVARDVPVETETTPTVCSGTTEPLG